jgi:hypothetical protein
MGAFDSIITLLLYACYGVYVVMGLCLLILGIVYMGDAGAIGTTGIWLCIVGFVMLIIGGIAIFANLKGIWLLLLIIELINVVLFLGLYIMIVVVLMMASGTTDPIRRATTEGWTETKKSLTLAGSDGTTEGIYCETQTQAPDCKAYYAAAKTANINGCKRGITATIVREGLINCSSINDEAGCSTLAATCASCSVACMEQQILDVKDAILPMSIFVFCMVGYLFIVTCVNTIISHGDVGDGGIMSIIGMVLNGILALIALILVIMGCVGAYQADDAGGDVPTSMIVTILTGFGILVVALLATLSVAGKLPSPGLMLQVSTGIMVFFCIFLTLMALLLGISSGAVMDDMDYYYEQNYPKLRSAMEKADNSYCQMTAAECTALVLTGTKAPVKNEAGDVIAPAIEPNEVWDAQHAEAAAEAQLSITGANTWLTVCKTTGICIYCSKFLGALTQPVGVYDKRANATFGKQYLEGAWCDLTASQKSAKKADSFCVKAADPIDYHKALRWKKDATGKKYLSPKYTKHADDKPDWLADQLNNYTKAQAKAKKTACPSCRAMVSTMGYCEMAIGDYVVDTDKCPENPLAADANSYKADCQNCISTAKTVFQFTFSGSGKDYFGCTNFLVGHVEHECKVAVDKTAATCRDQFTGNEVGTPGATTPPKTGDAVVKKADAAAHTKRFVDAAVADGSRSAFCGYPDRACKQKIQDAVENSMTSISIFGCIFLVFFLAILFFTMHAINYYRDGGGDDDDDDDDDDDSDE